MKPLVWVNDHLINEKGQARLKERYDLVVECDRAKRAEVLTRHGKDIEAIVTFGSIGLSAEDLEQLPKLRLVQCMGVGYEKIDLVATRCRRVAVTNARGSNDVCVADHAMALLLSITRDIAFANRVSHERSWNDFGRTPPIASYKRLGLVGLGMIGSRIAQRASGFEMEIAYHARREHSEVSFPYFASPRELAARSDYLVIAVPGGEATHHLIDESVIAALPTNAFLINVGRGTVVKNSALFPALRDRRIAGAALDVLEGEPLVAAELRGLDNLILTPHIGGISPESNEAALRLALGNLDACFDGRELLTPV